MNEVPATKQFVYDEVPYPPPVLPGLTPDRLRAAGFLHGWRAPDPVDASILEIGCGDGLNLISIAAMAPGSRCVGFDLSAAAIARGRELAGAVGLPNVDLQQGDILAYPREGHGFDYIICHGVYTWVPEPVRGALLELIAARLAPGGVAYVSLDCLPAAGPKAEIVRFLRSRVGHIPDPEDRALEAMRLCALLARNQHPESRLKLQLDKLLADAPGFQMGYFFHDWLAEHYAPVRSGEFAAAAERVGLTVAGDAGLSDLYDGDLDPEALQMLGDAGEDMAARHAILDMLRGAHMFRRQLLVRRDAPPAAEQSLAEVGFAFLGEVEPEREDGSVTFRAGTSSSLTTRAPEVKAMMTALHRAAPNELGLDELCRVTGIDRSDLEQNLRRFAAMSLIEAHGTSQNFVVVPGEKPAVSPLLRTMMWRGDWGITQRHAKLSVEAEASRHFLALCDGTRTRAEIIAEMNGRQSLQITPPLLEGAIADLGPRRVFSA